MTSSPQPFLIRDARDDEREAIRKVTQDAYAQYATDLPAHIVTELSESVIRAIDTTLPVIRIVAEQHGQIVGSVMVFPADSAAYASFTGQIQYPELRLLAVAESARGQGVGRALVEACIARVKALGASTLGLHTGDVMHIAQSLYVRMGFVRAPEYDFSPDGIELVKAYRLDLTRYPNLGVPVSETVQ